MIRPLSLLLLCLATNLAARAAEPPAERDLLALIDAAIAKVRAVEIRTDTSTPWEVMHAMIPFGKTLEIYDARDKRKVGAIGWLLESATWDDKRIFQPIDGGVSSWSPGKHFLVQDHPDQYLSKFGRSGVALDEKLIIDGKAFTVADMVRAAQWNIKPGQEVSFSLTALLIYAGLDAKWKNSSGVEFDIARVLKMEVDAEPNYGACGGTHGLFALAHAINAMQTAGRKLEGPWSEAQKKIDRYKLIAFAWQGDTGYFSAGFFEKPARPPTVTHILYATGHTLEFLSLAGTDEEIRGDKMRRAAALVARTLIESVDGTVKKGTLYHAANGLILYRRRLTVPSDK